MTRGQKRILWVGSLAILLAAALWTWVPNSVKHALSESLRPTTVEMMPLPDGCAVSNEAPPSNLMRIVEYQKTFYHLALQKVVVCRSAKRFTQAEPTFTEEAFGEDVRKRWLPLYVGCCSYQYRRHVAVVVADVNQSGSLIVEAALTQSRWAYYRSNWATDRPNWH